MVEESPVGSSGSNGVVERTVQAVEGQIRVILLALEARLGATVAATEPIVTYNPDHAMYDQRKDDGKIEVEVGLWDFRRREAQEQRNLGSDGGKDVESEIGATTARGCPMVVGFRDLGPPYDVEPIPR